ncbi:toxin VasX [Psychrobacter sp. CAL495-MNA-CIBAN-0180]|uniref:toxin VasX n=1 Tax=unclassified Psychrobacter TaxID=196806 RepID=UPI00046F341F
MAERCEQCLTEGFMFVPTRTGYIFNDKSLETADRLLREGYLYILDDKGNWYGYVITEKRYFKQFELC